jgi:hypothetical protein
MVYISNIFKIFIFVPENVETVLLESLIIVNNALSIHKDLIHLNVIVYKVFSRIQIKIVKNVLKSVLIAQIPQLVYLV